MSLGRFAGGLFVITVGAITGLRLGLYLHLNVPLVFIPTALGGFTGLYVAVKYFS